MDFLNNSKIAKFIKNKDWRDHPLGEPKSWPLEFKVHLSTILSQTNARIIYFGENNYTFFNDALVESLGEGDHLNKIGVPGVEMWGELWPSELVHSFEYVMSGKGSVDHEDKKLMMPKNGRIERTYWTYNFSPLKCLGGNILGVLVSCIDKTADVLAKQRLSNVLESSSDFIAAVGLDMKYLFFNNAHANEYKRVFGKKLKIGVHVLEKFLNFPDEKLIGEKIWKRALSGEIFSVTEEFCVEKSGPRTYQLSYSPIFDDNGEVVGSTQISRDVSEFIRNEQDLYESQQSFIALSESMPQIVWSASASGENEYCNKKWTEYTGINVEDARTGSFFKAFHPEDAVKAKDKWVESLKNVSEFSTECRLLRADGEYRWFLIRALPYEFNSINSHHRWVGTCTDIHDHKMITDQLSKSEDRLNVTLNSSGICLWDYDLHDEDVYLSDTFIDEWGIDSELFNGEVSTVLDLIHPSDRKRVILEIELTIQQESSFDIEFRIIKNDKLVWMNAKGRSLYNKLGSAVRLSGTCVNITKKKKDVIELQKAMKQAESANHLKSAFLANMSHEIRTPLGVISGFNDLLLAEDISINEKKQYSSIVKKTTEQLITIINDILDLSKVESGEFVTENIKFSISELVKDTVKAFSVKAEQKGLKLDFYISEGAKDLFISDPTRIKQILFNLMSNAIKFTNTGSIDLFVKREGSSLTIAVEDSGIGIPTDKINRLFKPFSQSDVSMTRKYGGTGLGLALSKKLAQLLEGSLELTNSEEGKGSLFTLTVEEQSTKELTPDRQREHLTLDKDLKSISGLKILLVEDAKENQILFKTLLEARGVSVDIANNGLEGVQKALTGSHNLVLMDIQMPVLDGYTATRRLRDIGFSKPIIALTAHAMSEVREQCLGVGCNDYATKPLNIETLCAKILNQVNPDDKLLS
jgi:PAS domain S-box-containing protein